MVFINPIFFLLVFCYVMYVDMGTEQMYALSSTILCVIECLSVFAYRAIKSHPHMDSAKLDKLKQFVRIAVLFKNYYYYIFKRRIKASE